MLKVFICCLLSTLILASQGAPYPSTIQNSNFEKDKIGARPQDWRFSAESGMRVEVQALDPEDTERCVVMSFGEGRNNQAIQNMFQKIDATQYRGKRLVFKTQIRVTNKANTKQKRAFLWVRVDRLNGEMGFFDNMANRQIDSENWTSAEIVGDISNDAAFISIGVGSVETEGELWIKSFKIETIDNTVNKSMEDPPKILTKRGVKNLVALSKAVNYLKYFHPSDEAANADWNLIVFNGIRAVEDSKTNYQLGRNLTKFFKQYLPDVKFYSSKSKVENLSIFDRLNEFGQKAEYVVHWKHFASNRETPERYNSIRNYIPLKTQLDGSKKALPERITHPILDDLIIDFSRIAIADQNKKTIPYFQGSEVLSPQTTSSGDIIKGRTAKILIAMQCWGIVDLFFPYNEIIRKNWDRNLYKILNSAAKIDNSADFIHELRQMLSDLKDGHCRVVGPEDRRKFGPKIKLRLINGHVYIQETENDPTILGSEILEIDNKPVQSIVEKLSHEISSGVITNKNEQLASLILLANSAEKIKIKLLTPQNIIKIIDLERGSEEPVYRAKQLPEILELKQGIWYIDLARVDRAMIAKCFPAEQDNKLLIFDARNYPRDLNILSLLSRSPIQSPQFFSPIVSYPVSSKWEWENINWVIPPAGRVIQGKFIFLVSGNTISAGETFISMVSDNKLGRLVGETTAGTNGYMGEFGLYGGYSMSMTIWKTRRQSGIRFFGHGIRPDYKVVQSLDGLIRGRDDALERAIAMCEFE